MKNNIEQLAFSWINSSLEKIDQNNKYYCVTRDVFQARLDHLEYDLKNNLSKDFVYLISAIAGEIGNNSFDHNLGSWPDVTGIFFGYNIDNKIIKIILVDRGQGILKTLKKIKPNLKNDQEALKTAFYERISGRAPENRGNGLKFVRESILDNKIHLDFYSGNAQATLNHEFAIKKSEYVIKGCLAILNIQITE